MVRFIIDILYLILILLILFTFQYGQIYYYQKNLNNMQMQRDLHSNMVRFIIYMRLQFRLELKGFTFQYGQIYYRGIPRCINPALCIYIPIWLDLLFGRFQQMLPHFLNLHSNMVRFIIYMRLQFRLELKGFTFQYGQIYYRGIPRCINPALCIYIPIWLDLLFGRFQQMLPHFLNLHSNMVRFIIRQRKTFKISYGRFTFQYGQIYYTII